MSNTEKNSNIEVLNTKVDMTYRQKSLCARYAEYPEEAKITDWAKTTGSKDPVHGNINLGRSIGGADIPQDYLPEDTVGNKAYGVEFPIGIHKAVGGDHDLPNPGNILSAALATCLDSTIRIIANRMKLPIKNLQVTVASHADVRGTLVVDRDVPVKFQEINCMIEIEPAEDTNPKLLEKLHKAVEYSCVNLQTLRNGTNVNTNLEVK